MPRTRKTEPSNGYIAYYRVSSVRQGESGLGLEAQREAVLRLAKTGAILAEYTEVESGKRHTNRPQLLAAMADCKRRKAVLLIAKLDRLARNVHFISGLMESGVEFVAADLPHANRLTIHILAAMAEHEREMISQRTQAGMDAAKAEIERDGFRISRRSGKPYSKHGNPNWAPALALANKAKAHPRERVAEIAAQVQAYRGEGLTLRAIAARLNLAGVRTATGASWHASTVRAALMASAAAATPESIRG